MQADVAQLVEQLIRNQQVVSSSLTVGSRIRMVAWPLVSERSFLLRLGIRFGNCPMTPFAADGFLMVLKEPRFLGPLKGAGDVDSAVFPLPETQRLTATEV